MRSVTESKINKFDFIFPGIAAVLIYLSILYWLKLNTNLPHWDMGRHLYMSVVYDQLWARVWHNPIHFASVVSNYYYYPPVVHNIGLLFESIFGFRPSVAVASNIVWLLTIAYSIYFTAHRLFGRLPAVASMLFALASPMIIGQLHEFQLDMPLTAMISLSIFLLLKTERFSNPKYTILLGAVAGLGMMTKWTYIIFMVPSLLILLADPIAVVGKNKKAVWKNLLIAFGIAIVICGAWYLRNLGQIRIDFMQNGLKQAVIEGDPHGFNKAAFLWYFYRLNINYLFLPLGIYFILGTFTVLIRRSKRRAGVILLAVALVWYLIISALANKDVRYIMPEIIILSLIGGLAVELFANKYYKILMISLIVLIFLTNWIIIPFSKYLPFKTDSYALGNNYTFGTIFTPNGYTSNSPKDEVCPMERIVDVVPTGKNARQIGISNIDFSDWSVAYYLEKSGRTWSGQTDDLSNTDYIIHRNSDVLPSTIASSPFYQTATPIASFRCLDGSYVYVLKTTRSN